VVAWHSDINDGEDTAIICSDCRGASADSLEVVPSILRTLSRLILALFLVRLCARRWATCSLTGDWFASEPIQVWSSVCVAGWLRGVCRRGVCGRGHALALHARHLREGRQSGWSGLSLLRG
jgi:hypothetical protein